MKSPPSEAAVWTPPKPLSSVHNCRNRRHATWTGRRRWAEWLGKASGMFSDSMAAGLMCFDKIRLPHGLSSMAFPGNRFWMESCMQKVYRVALLKERGEIKEQLTWDAAAPRTGSVLSEAPQPLGGRIKLRRCRPASASGHQSIIRGPEPGGPGRASRQAVARSWGRFPGMTQPGAANTVGLHVRKARR